VLQHPRAGWAGARHDGYGIRAAAVHVGVPLITTVQGVTAAVQGIEALQQGGLGVRALQELDHSPKHATYAAAKTHAGSDVSEATEGAAETGAEGATGKGE